MAVSVYFASLFVNFVFFAPVVETTVSSFTFKDVGIPGMVFTNHSVFDITARNALRCANQCSLHGDCATFTFTERSPGVGHCRGYSPELNVTNSDMVSETGAQTYSMGVCGHVHYTVLDDYRRHVNNTIPEYADISTYWQDENKDHLLTPGWYRFKLNGTNAVMPTYCVLAQHCSTYFPVWLNLMGEALPRLGEEKEALSCLTVYDNCCYFNDTVTVRNCGDFFIYKLQPTLYSIEIYCVSL